MFTEKQRGWVTSFMAKTGAGNGLSDLAEEDAPGAAEDGGDAPQKGGSRHELTGGVGEITNMSATCHFENATKELLTVVQDSLDIDDGKLTTLPDAELKGGDKTTWVAENSKIPTPIPWLDDVGPFGVEGHIKYTFPDGQTVVTLHFNNPRLENGGKNQADASIVGPKAGDFKATATFGSGNKAVFNFKLTGKGGDGPGPGPTPSGETQANTSCLVTIVNQTQQTLLLDDQGNETGDFMTNPASSLAPGASCQFAYVGTPGAKTPGCKGHVTYRVGDPAQGTWKMEWNNPVGEKNTATSNADSQFHTLEQIGQGEENVPVTFTLSGGTPGGGGQVVPPVPPGPEDPPFEPPAGDAKEPTLRKGDKSPDGWVEYLQECLLVHGQNVTVDGNFGAATHKAVLAFQTQNKLQVDGTVGNQTWAALRKGAPQPPSTDGRAPHSYKEDGVEARFFTERDVFYNPSSDSVLFTIVSVGDPAGITGKMMTARITPPGGKPRVVQAPLTDPIPMTNTDQGSLYTATLAGFTKAAPSNPPGAPATAYVIEAYLDRELGGDSWKGSPEIAA
jgi:peptidoglycan hydrolase-like protein with peptidoglycan-binding domain